MNKKGNKMIFRIGFILLVGHLFLACATQKDLGKNAKSVTIVLSTSTPYCGGAAPTPEMQVPKLAVLPNYALKLFLQNDDDSRGMEITTVTSDEFGSISLDLPVGKYQLWKPTKSLSLEEFIKIESPEAGKNFEYKDKECFLAWKETPDFTFEVLSDTTINVAYYMNCYTGAHPCKRYTGPLRP